MVSPVKIQRIDVNTGVIGVFPNYSTHQFITLVSLAILKHELSLLQAVPYSIQHCHFPFMSLQDPISSCISFWP